MFIKFPLWWSIWLGTACFLESDGETVSKPADSEKKEDLENTKELKIRHHSVKKSRNVIQGPIQTESVEDMRQTNTSRTEKFRGTGEPL